MLAEALSEASQHDLAADADPATNSDLARRRTARAESKAEMLKWAMVGLIGIQTVAIVGAMVWLTRVLAQ